VFYYTYKKAAVTDSIYRDPTGEGLIRRMTITLPEGAEHYYVMLARGGPIRRLPDGDYAVHDASLYISHLKTEGTDAPGIRRKGSDELICALKAGPGRAVIQYEIIW
jgi:hypothetical protein